MQNRYDFIEMEHRILDFWENEQVFTALREKNRTGKPFRFLDGPITANNPMGVHHAWGRTVKDTMLRYKAMTGHNCLYRNGFDTQGLWVEVEVEKELGFAGKKETLAYGMDRFTEACIARTKKYAGMITGQSKRLGQWMDWDNSYFTHADGNITAIWHFLKTCHERGWIGQENRPMPWCPRCGTSLSEHEMTGSHREWTHEAVFVTAPVDGLEYDMLVWTTTPWTLTANAALAVNPELTYACVQVPGRARPLVMAQAAVGHMPEGSAVLRTMAGRALTGLFYRTFFPDLPVQQGVTHTIVPWEEVQAEEGSGVVHLAPGCGAEDYALGKAHGLAEICPVDEEGRFYENYGFLGGLTAEEAAPQIFQALEERGRLWKTHAYTHSYPVCWRCKTPVLFRLVREWYIRTDEIRPHMLAAAETVQWSPPSAGKRMTDWLTHMGDWNISRKRFYGLPLPFYPCPHCGKLTVVGSMEEFVRLGGEAAKALPHLHRPWIDEVPIACPGCGASVSRIPEVGDVWLDAGITPFSTQGYFEDRAAWDKQFPAEWVTEMREQVRLWFYALLFMSVTLTGKAPYERVLAHGGVVQEDGSKFSKTGFMIRFDDAAERVGADAVRYLYAGANPAADMRFGDRPLQQARRRILDFWNICVFFTTYAEIDKPRLDGLRNAGVTDRWLENRVQTFVNSAAQGYERYDTPSVVRAFEECVDDVSNWYVRISRRRFWQEGMGEDKAGAYAALYHAIRRTAQVMAPILPFVTEQVWQSVVRPFGLAEQSVHLSDFPHVRPLDERCLKDTDTVRRVIAAGLSLRSTAGVKVKQPLPVFYAAQAVQGACADYQTIIREELNVKNLVFLEDFSPLQEEYLELNFRKAGQALGGKANALKDALAPMSRERVQAAVQAWKEGDAVPVGEEGYPADFFVCKQRPREGIVLASGELPAALDTALTEDLVLEGIYREILRHCQVLRKEAGFALTDRVRLCLKTDDFRVRQAIARHREGIEREALATVTEELEETASASVKAGGVGLTISVAG